MHDSRWWRGAALFLLVSMLAPAPAFAYIGPGVAAGAVASALGVLGSIVLGIFSVIYYPIKRLFKKRRKRAGGKAESAE
jgi:membrane protein implicated in regulation of membrane protease activity